MRIVLSAGEASGDHIGANLARALHHHHPGIELAGIAGPAMREAGVRAWYDIDELNVMGLTEVLRHVPRLFRLRRRMARRIGHWGADAFVGIDAPDFNLGLARRLHRAGRTTAIHYVCPSVWAWRAHRIPRIARSLDLLLTLYPFEPALFEPHGLKACFVGHHLADLLVNARGKTRARAALSLDADEEVIALLPGSRPGEIQRHARLLGETAEALRHQRPEARLLVLLADPSHEHALRAGADGRLERAGVEILTRRTRLGLRAASVAVAASGTVTLEAFLLECPLVVYYRLPTSTYWLARSLRLVRSEFVSLPNIMAERELVPERLQHAATAERLASDTVAWLDAPDRLTDYQQTAVEWRERLATGAGDVAARRILDCLESRS